MSQLGFSPPDFTLARACFILASVVLVGMTTVWLWKNWRPNRQQLIVGAFSYLLAIAWLIGSMIYISQRELAAQTPQIPPSVNGNCNSFGNHNSNCNTFNMGPVPRRLPKNLIDNAKQTLAQSGATGTIEVQTDIMGCPDCDGFAKQFEDILRAAPDLTVRPVRNGMTMTPYRGIALGVKDKEHPPAGAEAVLKAFHKVGMPIQIIQEAPALGSDMVLEIFQPQQTS